MTVKAREYQITVTSRPKPLKYVVCLQCMLTEIVL